MDEKREKRPNRIEMPLRNFMFWLIGTGIVGWFVGMFMGVATSFVPEV